MWTLSPNQRRRAHSPSLLKRTLTMSYKNLGTAPIVLRFAALILARRVTLTRGIGLAADSPVAAKSQLKAITFGLVIGGDLSPQLEEGGLRRNTLQESKGCKLGKAISSETQKARPPLLQYEHLGHQTHRSDWLYAWASLRTLGVRLHRGILCLLVLSISRLDGTFVQKSFPLSTVNPRGNRPEG